MLTGDLQTQLEAYDRKRRNTFLAAGLLLVAGLTAAFIVRGETGMLIAVCAIVIAIVTATHGNSSWKNFYHDTLIPLLLARVAPTLKYQYHSGMPRNRFEKLQLYSSFDRYKTWGRISGVLGKTRLEISGVHAEKRYRSKKQTSYSTVFRGVIFSADCNKNFSSRTLVLPDFAEKCFGKLVGNFLQKMNFTEGSLVKLENVEFEKEFSVYGGDQIESRYLLTPDMMERLLKIKAMANNQLRLVFQDGNVTVAMENFSWMSPAYCGKVASIKFLEQTLQGICRMTGLVEALDLNTRIWSKQ